VIKVKPGFQDNSAENKKWETVDTLSKLIIEYVDRNFTVNGKLKYLVGKNKPSHKNLGSSKKNTDFVEVVYQIGLNFPKDEQFKIIS